MKTKFTFIKLALVALVMFAVGLSAQAASKVDSVSVGSQSPTNISPGFSATFPITATGNGNGSCTFSVTNTLPTGATASFSPNPASGNGSWSSTLTISTTGSTPAGTYSFTVQAVGDNGSPTALGTLTVVAGAAKMLAFGVNPTTTTTNYAISPAVTVIVEDQYGNRVTSDASTVTIAGTATSFTADSTLSVAAVNGVATFSNLKPTTASTNTLTASDGSLTGATSSAFKVNRPPVGGTHYLTTLMNTNNFKVSAATLAGLDYDADGDTLTITSVNSPSTQGGTVSLSGGNVTYTPASGFAGTDTFTYTISDGFTGGTATSTANVTVRLGNATSSFTASSFHGTEADLRGYGIPTHQYDVQVSTDMVNWSTLTTVTAAGNGIILYTNYSSPQPTAFYRFAVH